MRASNGNACRRRTVGRATAAMLRAMPSGSPPPARQRRAEAMVATSQPLATRAGLRALERGGNAVDAALAAAAVLCVTEPMSTGIGGDAFALVWDGERLHGLDAAGPAPRGADPVEPVAERAAVGDRAGRGRRLGRARRALRPLGLDALPRRRDRRRRGGFAVGPITAAAWAGAAASSARFPGGRPSPPRARRHAAAIAEEGPAPSTAATSRGDRLVDLARGGRPRRLRAALGRAARVDYRGVTVCELPPPTQGVAALEALGLLASASRPSRQVECVRLALEDAFARVRDGADVGDLLDPASSRAAPATPPRPSRAAGGTVYLCAVDGDGMAVSFIQSLYEGFGCGVVAPGTGVVLQNRGACFAVSGAVEPGRAVPHDHPGDAPARRRLLGPVRRHGRLHPGQAHVQLVSALVDDGLDPQAALDRPRFRVDGDDVLLEEGLWERAAEVEALGLRPSSARPRPLRRRPGDPPQTPARRRLGPPQGRPRRGLSPVAGPWAPTPWG